MLLVLLKCCVPGSRLSSLYRASSWRDIAPLLIVLIVIPAGYCICGILRVVIGYPSFACRFMIVHTIVLSARFKSLGQNDKHVGTLRIVVFPIRGHPRFHRHSYRAEFTIPNPKFRPVHNWQNHGPNLRIFCADTLLTCFCSVDRRKSRQILPGVNELLGTRHSDSCFQVARRYAESWLLKAVS